MLSDVIGVIHPTVTTLTPRIGGIMIITQIIETITMTEKKTCVVIEITGTEATLTTQTITEKETGVITGITGTEVTLTTQTIANTEILEATGSSAQTEITEVTENMVETESTETTNTTGGRRHTPQVGCPLEHRIGHTLVTRVKCLWRDRFSSTPSKLHAVHL